MEKKTYITTFGEFLNWYYNLNGKDIAKYKKSILEENLQEVAVNNDLVDDYGDPIWSEVFGLIYGIWNSQIEIVEEYDEEENGYFYSFNKVDDDDDIYYLDECDYWFHKDSFFEKNNK